MCDGIEVFMGIKRNLRSHLTAHRGRLQFCSNIEGALAGTARPRFGLHSLNTNLTAYACMHACMHRPFNHNPIELWRGTMYSTLPHRQYIRHRTVPLSQHPVHSFVALPLKLICGE